MTAKELIEAEITTLTEKELDELYNVVKKFVEAKKKRSPSTGLLTRLRQIKIQAPPDFAGNLDMYISGEKSVE